ncbi:MAG: Rieske (2Fe-2S) protein [Dehalococcoidia bacterium]
MPDQTVTEFDLCSLAELQARNSISFRFIHPRFGKHEIAVFWDGETVGALENYCPHEGALLSHGLVERGEVICPLHSAVFDIKTGECVDKYTYDTTAYEAEVRDGRVYIKAPGEQRAP